MKIKLLYLLWILGSLFSLIACSEDEEQVQPSINLQLQEGSLTLGAERNALQTLTFTTTHPWKISSDCNWLVLTPESGQAGETSVRILAREDNRTGEERDAVITLKLTATDVSRNITLRQSTMDVLNIQQSNYSITAEMQDIDILFSTNVPDCEFHLNPALSTDLSWINVKQPDTRALQERKISLTIQANPAQQQRTATFTLQGVVDGDALVQSDVITITQAAMPVGTSSDYSADKQVFELQRHTIGNGIPLIFMGDGFLDKDIASGFYRQVMAKGVENFFTEEPIKSLRDYFDIWYVNAVSANNAFGDGYSTKFGCRLAGGGSTLIEGNHEGVMAYAMNVPALKNNPELFNEATCIVILNTEEYAGTCYFGFNDGIKTINLAIGYCPMIYGMEDDMFRRVLCHECIGHGFSKLLDEYSYQEMGRIPTSEISETQKMQELGWAANVDFTNDRNSVLWSKFLKDSRYQGKDNYDETLGIYEGACTYWSGAYRPTNESMMRSNMHGFNAPSREAIYKRVMSTAYGKEWEYNYEEFVAFDQAHLPMPTEATTRATYKEATRPFSLPVFTNMTIRFAY